MASSAATAGTTAIPQSASISKPEHQGRGRSKHTTYLIETEFVDNKAIVRRRYKDFVWLQSRLVVEKAGIIVPVFPNTSTSPVKQRFEEDFVASRQGHLRRFLDRILSHPELVDAPCLYQFLTANPKDWQAIKESTPEELVQKQQSASEDDESSDANIVIDAQAATVSEAGKQKKHQGWGAWMKERRTKIAINRGNIQLEETPSEAKTFADLKASADHLETCIRILTQDCAGWIQAQNEASSKMRTMGAAFSELWGEHDLQTTSTSEMYQRVGESWADLSKSLAGNAQEIGSELLTPFEELVLEVMALQQALDKRKDTLIEYTKHVHHGNQLQKDMQRLKSHGGDLSGAKQDQFFQLETSIVHSDKDIKESKERLEVITDRLYRDVVRFRKDFHSSMQLATLNFHKAQSDRYAQLLAPMWHSPVSLLEQELQHTASQPQIVPKAAAPTLSVSYTTSGASVSVDTSTPATSPSKSSPTGPNTPPKSAFSMVPTTPTGPISMVPTTPTGPTGDADMLGLNKVPEPVMDADGAASFAAMSILGDSAKGPTAPTMAAPPAAAPPPPPVPTSPKPNIQSV